jgi:4-aminobutyrate---pyruvate transaminase
MSVALPNSIEGRDLRSVVHGATNLSRHLNVGPLVIDRGNGINVFDTQGKSYIEAMSGLWCASLGWSQERLVEACTRQMRKLAYGHLIDHRGHQPVVELAEKLLDIAPAPMARVWFANSGSEAIDCAARIAWYFWNAEGRPEKRKFLAHRRAYHGNTIAAASLTGIVEQHTAFNLPLSGFCHVRCPHFYREGKPGETEDEFIDRLIAELELRIEEEGANTIAAFFAEPVMAAGGVVIPPPRYFARLQEVLGRNQILLVADEVVTGFGRIGEMFGCTRMGLSPDMIACAKGITGAYFPLSALMINARIFEAMVRQSDEVGLFGLTLTYSGHPVGAAIAREAIAIYEEEDIPVRCRRLEPQFLSMLRSLESHPLVGEVRGIGLIGAVELVRCKQTRSAFNRAERVGARCAEFAAEEGLLVRAIGDTIAICPPLVISETEISQLADRLSRALDRTAAHLRA